MLHGFFAMFTGSYAISAFVAYLLFFTVLREKPVMLYGLANHALSSLFSIFAVIAGFEAQSISYVKVKAPWIMIFLHKSIAIFTVLFIIGTFLYMWTKQEDTTRIKGIAIAVVGLFLSLLTVVLGLDIIFDFVAR